MNAKCDYCDQRATTLAGDTNGVLVCEDHVRLFAEREIAAAIDHAERYPGYEKRKRHMLTSPPAVAASTGTSEDVEAHDREHGTDHGHVAQVGPHGVLSTRLTEPNEWFCGHCGMGVPEAADARGVRESGSQDADGSQVRPLASVSEASDWWCLDAGEPRQVACCTACVPSLSALLSDFYNSDDGDYVSALGDIHKHVAAREAAARAEAWDEGYDARAGYMELRNEARREDNPYREAR